MKVFRNKVIVLTVLIAFGLLCVVTWLKDMRDNEGGSEYPTVTARCINNTGNEVPFGIKPGGFSLRYSDAVNYTVSDFTICFPENTLAVRDMSEVVYDGTWDEIIFEVISAERLSGIQVLRWPFSSFGTTSPLDSAELVPYYWSGKNMKFKAEKGFVYTIYITWRDCFIEWPFQVK